MTVEAFPLHWPAGRSRTLKAFTRKSQFTPGNRLTEVANVTAALKRLGARNIVVSTNVRLRNDGLPYAQDKAPSDQGVAVYFDYAGGQKCFACDRWATIPENLRAIFKSIEAIRGLERWGSKDFVDAAFTGFAALPSPNKRRPWREVMDFMPGDDRQITEVVINDRYKRLAKVRHPDSRTGSDAMMAELNGARDDALAELEKQQ